MTAYLRIYAAAQLRNHAASNYIVSAMTAF